MSEDIEHPWIFWPALILLMIGSLVVMKASRSTSEDENGRRYLKGLLDQDISHMKVLKIDWAVIADDPSHPGVGATK